MAKLTMVVVLVYAMYFGSLKLVKSQEDILQDTGLGVEEDFDVDERSGRAIAKAKVSIGPRLRPSSFTPSISSVPPSPSTSKPSVECYVCTDCPNVLPNTTTKLCPKVWDGTKDRTCVTYAEKYNHLKRPWYIRGCASERGNCQEIKQTHAGHADIVKLMTCHECQGDKCNTNGASRSLTDTTMAFIVLIVTPLVAKYTMS